MSVTTTRDVRYPLIVVDWTADRNRYDSRWLRLIGPADLADLQLTDACQSWDGHGRPVTIRGTSVTMTTTAVDPAVANILREWRSRAPLGVAPGTMSGATAIPFLVDDVAVARSKLTGDGTTPSVGMGLRLLPVALMLISAAAIFPLLRDDPLTTAVAFLGYVVSSALMRRWSYPPARWGAAQQRDPHDAVSRLAVGAKVLFWVVAGVSALLVVLDWAELVPGLVAWA